MSTEKFETFLLAEYEHIADAHFETGKQVSKFFNYYLLILAASVVIVSLIQNQKLNSIINPGQDKDVTLLHWLIFIILSIIAVVGFLLCWVVVELQHDSILYARTVNGIRDYFYSEAQLPPTTEKATRVLPRDVNQPDFYSKRHLGIIVFTFSIVNTAFASAACFVFGRGELSLCLILVITVYFLIHFIALRYLSRRRTAKYPGTR